MPSNNNPQTPKVELDPTIVNLTKAIRDVESGGNFQARGQSGEFGAYQFMPKTWASVAPKFGVSTALEMATPEEQNKVAYDYVKSLRDQGYNAGQIASIWNSGRSNPAGRVGVNASGASYNTPQYVDNVYNRYLYYKGDGTTPDADGRPGTRVGDLPEYHALFPSKPGESPLIAGAKATANVIPSAVGLVKDVASLVFNPIDTVKNIAGVAIGGIESLDDEAVSENTEKFDLFVQALKDRYGSLEALQNTATNDPFGFGADIMGVLYGGASLTGKTAGLNRAVDITGAAGAAPFRAVGNAASRVATRPFSGSVDAETAAAAGRLGIEATELPASARSTSRVVPLAEALAGKTIGGEQIAVRQTAAAERLTSIADDLVAKAEGATDLIEAGQVLAKGVKEYADTFKETVKKLYDDFEAKRGDTIAQTSNTVRVLDDILTKKESIGDVEGMRFFENKLRALTGGKQAGSKKKYPAPTFSTVKEMRTDIGQRVNKAFGDMFVTANKAQLKQFYAALTSDMRATIKSTRNSKKLIEALDEANAAYKAGRTNLDAAIIKKIQNLSKEKRFDRIVPALLQPSVSQNEIKLIMALTGEGGANQIRTSLLNDVFNKAKGAGGEFTPAGIEKQLIKHGEKWKQILTPQQYQALEDLAQLSKALGRSKKISEGSQTAYTLAQLGQYGIAGWSFIDLMQGNLAAFAQKWAFLGMGYGASKIIASPFGQKFLTTGILRRAEVQAEVARQGLTPPVNGDIIATYGESASDIASGDKRLPGNRDRGADSIGDGKTAPLGSPSGDGARNAELISALTPILDRAKARSGLDFNVEDVQMTGSRSAGKGKKGSDMDVIVQISGNADEAAVLAALRRGRTKVDGAKVDYTVTKEPISDLRSRTEDPEKYAAPLTSEFVADTKVGRLKESLRKYMENMGVGLSTRDVSGGGQNFDIGLTSVKGAVETAADDLVKEADALYAAGNFLDAQKKYNEALAAGTQTLQKAFEGTGIKVKPKGVGFGVYGGLEPNYDAVAVVPRGKEDLFHYVLADVADRDFKQYSMLTYRQAAPDTQFGIVDEARGISVEPHLRFSLEKELTGEDIPKLQKIAEEAGLAGLSIREGGKTIDIINLSAYDKNYEVFKQKVGEFARSAKSAGFSGVPELRVSEVRFAGSDPSEGHGLASYQSVRNQFRSQNPDFFNSDEGFTSRVIDRIKNRQTVSPMEIEQMTKMQDITPLERSVVLSALDDLKDVKKIATKDLVARIEGKSLPVSMYETDSYASYGIDNVNLRENRTFPKTLVFETPVEHGSSGHFSNPKHFGHTRVAIVEEGDKKIGYITEMQSDVAQKTDLANKLTDKAMKDAAEKLRAKFEGEKGAFTLREQEAELVRARQAAIRENPSDQKTYDEYTTRIDAMREKMRDLEAEFATALIEEGKKVRGALSPEQQQLVGLLKDRNKYQDIMLRGTLQYFEKNGVDEVRVATPSTAAKIEGFVGDDDLPPYEMANGGRFGADADDLDVGDEVGYLGESYTVVQADGGEISIAPADEINSFRPQDFIDDERRNMWDEAEYELKKHADSKGFIDEDGLKKAQEGGLPYMAEKAFDFEVDGKISLDDLREKFEEKFDNEFDWRQSLEDIYGRDAVFEKTRRIASKMYSTDLVYIVEDSNKIENFNQPSGYSGVDESALLAIDEDPSTIGDYFSGTQQTVLENYVDLRQGALKKLEKTEGVKIKGGTSDDYYSNASWYSFPLTKVKRYLFGA